VRKEKEAKREINDIWRKQTNNQQRQRETKAEQGEKIHFSHFHHHRNKRSKLFVP
jgi:hypothetical protein